MSRAKKGAASEGQVLAQKEAAESTSSIEQLFKAIQDQMEKGHKELSDRLQKLGLKVQRHPLEYETTRGEVR